MLESLLSYRFRGTTLTYEELSIAIENKIADRVTTTPDRQMTRARRWELECLQKMTVLGQKNMENSSIQTLQFKQWTKKLGSWNPGKGLDWTGEGGKDSGRAVRSWTNGGNGNGRTCWSCGRTGHIAATCTKGDWTRHLFAVEEEKREQQ